MKFLYSISKVVRVNRILFGFLFTFFVILLLDLLAYLFNTTVIEPSFGPLNISLGFAPEVWMSILTLVLGTLIIVISIASQNTPRLIDLYLSNWISIYFMWFITLSAGHSVIFVIFEGYIHRFSSELLNSFILIPAALIVSPPYIFFILNYSKIDQIIEVLIMNMKKDLHYISKLSKRGLFQDDKIIKDQQNNMLKKINQLADLMSYLEYRESRETIVHGLIDVMEQFLDAKSTIDDHFFNATDGVKKDISFTNYTAFQFYKMEKRRTFLEEKILRIVGNCYNSFLEAKDYELASDCTSRIVALGTRSLKTDDDVLLSLITIRLNTLFRFSIKHGLAQKSSRAINNFIFQAGKLMDTAIALNHVVVLRNMFQYINIYGKELFLLGIKEEKIKFAVSFLLAEAKRILIKINEADWDMQEQETLLKLMLEVDDPDINNQSFLLQHKYNNNDYRMLLLALALYYCSEKHYEMAIYIVDDLIKDLGPLPDAEKTEILEYSLLSLEKVPQTFWEDTDRGTLNIFHCHETDLITPLLDVIAQRIKSDW